MYLNGPARAGLLAEQQRLEQHVTLVRTLDPQRERASTLLEVHARALRELPLELHERVAPVLAGGLAALARAQLDAFPSNLFWDLDLIAVEVAREAVQGHLDPVAAQADMAGIIEDRFARMARLQTLYGCASAINFSYVHDFVYGFDWAKWMAREPDLQAAPPRPFSLAFLVYMERRGHELLELIAADDHKYPQLAGNEARNPFRFSREPEHEIRLHRELARRGLIPVPTWDPDANVEAIEWSRAWQELRSEVARALQNHRGSD